MKRILFIRHGATAGNLERRYIGKTDEPLCDLGIRQATALKEQAFSADYLYVSPALRTVQTAQMIFPAMPYTEIPELWETDFGDFEGKTSDELADDLPYKEWIESNCLSPIPNGESVVEFKKRCCSAFADIAAKLPDHSTTVFVIHGGCIMAIMEAFAQPKKDFYKYHIPNGAFLQCAMGEDGALFVCEEPPFDSP